MTELEKEEALIDRSNIAPYQPIDLTELANKFVPKLSNKMPKFVYRYLAKILHLEELNAFFGKNHYCTGQQWLDKVREHLNVTIDFNGPGVEYIDKLTDQPVMFASNHPYGGPEGAVLFSVLHAKYPRARLLTQSFLKFLRPFSEVCVYNKKDIATLKQAVDEKRPLLYYPAGYCSRKLSFGDVFDYDWKRSFVKIAKQNNMPIIIIFTDGRMTKRTLRWTQFRKIFHIKASIETAFLPDEMFKLKNQTLKMTVAKPIYPDQLDDSVDLDEWAARLRQYCYELKSNPNAEFDPSKPATLPLT